MEVIDLSSDSNDSVSFNRAEFQKSSENNVSIKESVVTGSAHCISDDDFDFPEVPFARAVAKPIYSEPESLIPKVPCEENSNIEEHLLNKYLTEKAKSKQTTVAKNKNGLSSYDKELLKIQKLNKTEEAARKKAEKAAIAERLKSMKPGECMKYMTVIIDSGIQNLSSFDNLINELQSLELVYDLKSQIVPNSITWTRSRQKHSITTENASRYSVSEENRIMIIWDYIETVKRVADDTFVASILSIEGMIPGKGATLVIYGMKNYFEHRKNLKKLQQKAQSRRNERDVIKRRSIKEFQNLPAISKKQLELCLTEIQLRVNCNSRLIETPQELALLIHQYTKAIAEAPFKTEKRGAAQGQLDWYSAADNKDTVKVDKDGNGLKRLWQQQLCQFSLAKLETAEAIIAQYPTPLHLMEAYARCTPLEGAQLLQDIAIRRTAGPLTAVRKIGPELSKKLYLMFTTEDGDALLGND